MSTILSTISWGWYLAGFISAVALVVLVYLAVNKRTRPYLGWALLIAGGIVLVTFFLWPLAVIVWINGTATMAVALVVGLILGAISYFLIRK